MAKTLFQVWNEHVQDGTCSKKFGNWCAFRAYCTKNNLKAEDFAGVEKLTEPKSEAKSESEPEPKPETKQKAEAAQPVQSPAPADKSKGV